MGGRLEAHEPVEKAAKRGDPLYDRADAELLIGLGRRAERANARRWRRHVPLTALAVILAVATGRVAVAAAAIVALASWLLLFGVLLPRARERRRRAVSAAEQLHGLGAPSGSVCGGERQVAGGERQ